MTRNSKKKKPNYIILEDHSSFNLSKMVNEKIEEGYVIVGAPMMVPASYGSREGYTHNIAQAMILDEGPNKEYYRDKSGEDTVVVGGPGISRIYRGGPGPKMV